MMKRFFSILLSVMLLASTTACSNQSKEQNSGAEALPDTEISEQEEAVPEAETPEAAVSTQDDDSEENTDTSLTEQSETEQTETEQEEENQMKMNIQIGDNQLTATLVQNSSTEALVEMLSNGPVTIDMSDYANMEKVGPFPQSLPRNDESISTGAGDLILYQGNSFVIYYDTNSWNFTRLGKIDNVTQDELKEILGSGGVTAVLSLPTE